MADTNQALPELPRHEIDWKYGGMTVSRHGDWVRHSDAAAAISELRTEVERRGDVIRGHEATLARLQGDLLRAWLKLEASRLEREKLSQALASSCDDERSQLWEATTGGGCLRAIAAEAECERLRVGAERLKFIEENVRYVGRNFGEGFEITYNNKGCMQLALGETFFGTIDSARSAASGESAEGGV